MPAEKVTQMFAAFVLAAATAVPHVPEHVPPPNFTIPTAKGTQQLTDLRGKVVVLNFWATWCPPCDDELKYFVQALATYGDKIALYTISSEPPDVAASYLRLWNIKLPVIEDLDGSITKEYHAPPIPLTIVIDPAGNVSYISIGELSWNELQTAIDKALTIPPVGTPGSGVLR
jgi:cytochrome c biogenesis protein CcmG, thiol:disulfide interchange protein DsbE